MACRHLLINTMHGSANYDISHIYTAITLYKEIFLQSVSQLDKIVQIKKSKKSQRIEYGSFYALAMGGSPPGIVGINSQGGPLRSQHLGNPWNPPLWKTTVKLKETGNKPNEMVEEHFSQIPPVKEGEGWSVSCSCLELKCLERFVAGTTRVEYCVLCLLEG